MPPCLLAENPLAKVSPAVRCPEAGNHPAAGYTTELPAHLHPRGWIGDVVHQSHVDDQIDRFVRQRQMCHIGANTPATGTVDPPKLYGFEHLVVEIHRDHAQVRPVEQLCHAPVAGRNIQNRTTRRKLLDLVSNDALLDPVDPQLPPIAGQLFVHHVRGRVRLVLDRSEAGRCRLLSCHGNPCGEKRRSRPSQLVSICHRPSLFQTGRDKSARTKTTESATFRRCVVKIVRSMATRPAPPDYAALKAARPRRLSLPGGTAWLNLPAIQLAGLPAEPTRLAELLTILATGQQKVTEALKDDHRSQVQRIELAGGLYVWKLFSGSPLRRWTCRVRHWFRLSPAWVQWRGAAKLAQAGVRTAEPLALIQSRRLGPGSYGLLMPSIKGPNAHWYLKQGIQIDESNGLTAPRTTLLAQSIGRQIGQMTAQGLVNRDHKPGNLLVDEVCHRGEQTPVIIDQSAIRRRCGDHQVYRMLGTLLRTAGRVEPVPAKQGLACLKAMRASDPSFGSDVSLSEVARRVLALLEGS